MVTTRCYGHRGMGCSIPGTLSLLPENSISSFRKALECGVNGIEFDVYLTDLNEVIVCHGFTYNDIDGLICINCLQEVDGDVKIFPLDVTCENLKLEHNKVYIKNPWILEVDDTDININKQYTCNELNELYNDYIINNNCYISSNNNNNECLPILQDIFNTFNTKLNYNIELKDLLQPLLNEYNNISFEIGLLFNGNDQPLPSINRIIQCAKKYNAKYINVSHDFWKNNIPILGEDYKGEDSLKNFVDKLHENNLKLFTYWLQKPDDPNDFEIHIRNNVDVICPNDVEAAMNAIHKKEEEEELCN